LPRVVAELATESASGDVVEVLVGLQVFSRRITPAVAMPVFNPA
jgi:hypothetical protein